MRQAFTRYAAIASATVCAVAVTAGCGSSAGDVTSAPGMVSVVTSTNVYGDIVRQIAGGKATVTSIISDPSQDPHSYQASTKVQLKLSKAKPVVENGGGYDDFVDQMLSTGKNTSPRSSTRSRCPARRRRPVAS